jgi:hypothetical protein
MGSSSVSPSWLFDILAAIIPRWTSNFTLKRTDGRFTAVRDRH